VAIAFVDAVTRSLFGRTSLDVQPPAGAAAGDTLIISFRGSRDPLVAMHAPPVGWSVLETVDQTGASPDFRHIAYILPEWDGVTDEWIIGWGDSNTFQCASICAAYRGSAPLVVDDSNFQASGSSTASETAPSVTTVGADRKLVFLGGTGASRTRTAPAGFDERVEHGVLYLADDDQAAAGASGAKTATLNSPDWNTGILIALAEQVDEPVGGTLDQAAETDTAGTFTPDPGPTGDTVEQASETDAAGTLTPNPEVDVDLEQAAETDTAGGLSPAPGAVDIALEQAGETDAGGELSPEIGAPPVPPIHIRELPPLWLAHKITLPNGRPVRWGPDEPDPAMVPSGLEFGSEMPGGHAQASCSLPRKTGLDYGDTQGFADWEIYGAGGETAWQGRLLRAPAGDMSVTPDGVGWQAHLEDNKTAQFIGIDRDLGRWQGSSAQRRINLKGAGGNDYNPTNDGQSVADVSTGMPVLRFEISGHMPGVTGALAELWYDAGPGNLIAGLICGASEGKNHSNANFLLGANGADTDVNGGATAALFGVTGATSLATAYRALAAAKRWLKLQWLWSGGAFSGDEHERWRDVKQIAVIGDHGLPLHGATGEEGLLASDLIAYALARWAPLLGFTTGPNGTIMPTAWPIPHVTFPGPTTLAEMIRESARFELPDWAVWDKRLFYLHPPGARGRRWRFRVGPTKLKQTGSDMSRVWDRVTVSYRDPDGSTRTVGPPGSGADVEDAALQDLDPLNPAVAAGIPRHDQLDMGKVSQPGAAIEVGRRFLEETKQLDRSGSAEVVGHALDDRGIVHPYWAIRAGDYGSWVDAADTSYRKIVNVRHDDGGARAAHLDLDAPPQGLDAILARLDVDLIRLGIS
jgi:hypothetical protein